MKSNPTYNQPLRKNVPIHQEDRHHAGTPINTYGSNRYEKNKLGDDKSSEKYLNCAQRTDNQAKYKKEGVST